MKKKSLLVILLTIIMGSAFAQNMPQGMNYQAVARDKDGQVLVDQEIFLKISLLSNPGRAATVHYTETQRVVTNKFGLFTLVIGNGSALNGTWSDIPWSTAQVWMDVAIKMNLNDEYVALTITQLLAVPYAYYAGSAGAISTGNSNTDKNSTGIHTFSMDPPHYHQPDHGPNWTMNGNLDGNIYSYIGTADSIDLPFRTDTIERMRIYANGNINMVKSLRIGNSLAVVGLDSIVNSTQSTGTTTGALTVAGGAGIAKQLNVGGITSIQNTTPSTSSTTGAFLVAGGAGIGGNLNVGGTVNFGGASAFGGKLAITDATQSTNTSTGALTVVGGTGIGQNLNVGGIATVVNNASSTSASTGALVVTGGTGIGQNLNVGGTATVLGTTTSTSATTGAMVVTGGTGIGGNLNVGGTATVTGVTNVNNQLNVNSSVPDGQFLATFTNRDSLQGDGIKIKLGRAKSVYSPPTISSPIDSSTAASIKNLIRCDYSGNRLDLLGNIVLTATEEDAEAIAGMAVGVGNIIIGQLNSLLSLPISIGPYSTPAEHLLDKTELFGGLDLGALGSIPEIDIPALNIPALSVLPQTTVMPVLPTIDLSGIGVPSINLADLSFWGIPSDLCLSDATGSSPMNNDNEFIRFTDKNDAKMGDIRAVSVTNWSTNYLNPSFMYTLYGALTSSKIDKFHAQYHFKNDITTALKNYASLGVEYASGNGDYAEWLERTDANELINAGDIVAVKGGKITKNLEQAEQVMVVSHNPIVLGNVPPEGKNNMGNNIAFMGQVPVKVLGAVASGDYIIGQINTPGYGLAKHADDMTVEDFKAAVGRSWDSNPIDGPKMVNVVVGVHNGDYIKILKKFESKVNDSQIRLQKLEAKVDNLMKLKSSASKEK